MTRTSSVSTRLANVSDIPRVVAVVNAAYSIETFFGGTRTDAEAVAETMQNGDILVAESASGGIVACVYAQVCGARGYLGMLAVQPAQQGSGLGRLMVAAAEEHCRRHSCRYMDMTVLSLRPELLPLYRKLGYREAGTQEFHPPPSRQVAVECHLIRMSKPLS